MIQKIPHVLKTGPTTVTQLVVLAQLTLMETSIVLLPSTVTMISAKLSNMTALDECAESFSFVYLYGNGIYIDATNTYSIQYDNCQFIHGKSFKFAFKGKQQL